MAKTHLIADESLGGVMREYIEVDRKAVVGDFVYLCLNGEIRKVIERGSIGIFYEVGRSGVLDHEYKTLEPTDNVHIDGQRFRLVDRKAVDGEMVIVVDKHGGYVGDYENGDVFVVIKTFESAVDIRDNVGELDGLYHCEYHVLEPVSADLITVDTSQASPEVVELLANLARRVTSLEQQLRDTQGNVERQAQELETKTNAVDEKVEMVIDDIVTLDERTQFAVNGGRFLRDDDGLKTVEISVSFYGNPNATEIIEKLTQMLVGGGRE